MELTLLMRCASIALAVSLDNSEGQAGQAGTESERSGNCVLTLLHPSLSQRPAHPFLCHPASTCRPEIGGEDLVARHPVRVDLHQSGHGGGALWRGGAADEHAVGPREVLDGSALRQEFGVTQNLELDACRAAVALQDLCARFSACYW